MFSIHSVTVNDCSWSVLAVAVQLMTDTSLVVLRDLINSFAPVAFFSEISHQTFVKVFGEVFKLI